MKHAQTQLSTNVLVIIDSLKQAGAQVQARMLAEQLVVAGAEVSILLLEHEQQTAMPYLPGVKVISQPVGPLNKWSVIREANLLKKTIRQINPDVVHTFLFKANLVGALCARLAGVPVVVGSRRSMGYDLNKRQAILARVFNNLVDGVVVNAQAILDNIEFVEGGKLPTPVVIHNGVELPSNYKTYYKTPQEFGILANIRPIKGHNIALDAFANILPFNPKARLHLMGDRQGDGRWTEQIEEQARELKIENNIVWYDSGQGKNTFFSKIDVLVSSSLSEGLSNSILEGMAYGLPVIATSGGGSQEAIGPCGIVVSPNCHKSLAGAMVRFIQKPEFAEKLGNAARERARRLFSPEKMCESHLHWYRYLLKTTKTTSLPFCFRKHRRRIVFAIDSLDAGGSETQVRIWALDLVKKGIPVSVLCLREGGWVARELAAAGVDIRVLNKKFKVDPLFIVRQQYLLWKLNPLAIMPLLTTAGIWTLPAAALSRIPRIIFSMRATALTDDPKVRGPVWLLKLSLRFAQQVLGNSPEVIKFCIENLMVPESKIHLLPNAIGGENLRRTPRNSIRRKLDLPVNGPLFGIVARLVPVKDHALFLDVCEIVFKKAPSATALIVGDGPEEARLRNEIARRNLKSRVNLLGHREDAMEILRAMDASVLTSDTEGSPNAVLESLAVGTPIVSVDVGDVRRMIGSGGGIVSSDRDPEKLANYLLTILKTPKEGADPKESFEHNPALVLARLQKFLIGENGGNLVTERMVV